MLFGVKYAAKAEPSSIELILPVMVSSIREFQSLVIESPELRIFVYESPTNTASNITVKIEIFLNKLILEEKNNKNIIIAPKATNAYGDLIIIRKINDKIDFSEANKILEVERIKSEQYFKKALDFGE